ncbi:MAG: histidinol dehydrogenase [Spirochaetota bacterium]
MSNNKEYIKLYRLKELSKQEKSRIIARSFVETESVIDIVKGIIENVRQRGDDALLEYTKEFEKVHLTQEQIEVTPKEIQEAYDLVDQKIIDSLNTLTANIRRFHEAQMPRKKWAMEISPGLIGGQVFIPIEKVGSYVPGGRGWFPSAVMMSVIPAKVAGVPEVVVCTPSAPNGKINPAVLVACDITHADRIFKIGGAQAIAAMALGTQTIPRVYKVTGPGSKWVLAAFRLLQSEVAVGTQAGPGEGLIIADDSANPSYVAADLIIQAEHGTDSTGVLVTASNTLAKEVQKRIGLHIEKLDDQHKYFVTESLRKYGAIIVTDTHEEAIEFANEYAVEHLEIQTKDVMHDMLKIKNAGGIYLGDYTPLSCGCFGSGPNHVLPTAGKAYVEGGLSTQHFLKAVSFEYFSKEGLSYLRNVMVDLANYEGFPAHRDAILVRFQEE